MTAQNQTEIRHKLLENGYIPLANVDKRCMLRAWPTLEVDHDTIDDWGDRRGLRATGVRMEGDLVALDFDIDDEGMLDRIWDAVAEKDEDLYEKLETLPLRAGKGAKVCLFGRLETGKIDKLWSKAFYKPGERETNGVLHRLEVFTGSGAGGARQVGIYGAHTFEDGEVKVAYRWADGRGLAEVPREELPALRRKDVFALVDIVSRVMYEAGWDYEVSSRHGKVTENRCYTLLPNMRFEVLGGPVVCLEELEALADSGGVRVSLAFAEKGAVNRSRGLVGVNPVDGRVQIYDTATASLYRPADLDMASKIGSIGAGLKRLGLGVARSQGASVVQMGVRSEAEDEVEAKAGSAGEEEVLVSAEGRCIVEVGEGNLAEATWLTARWLAGQEHLYRRGGAVAHVVGGNAVMMTDSRLAVEIGERVMCAREEKSGGAVRLVEVDPPAALVRQVGAVVEEVSFRDLRGVVDVPVVRLDGSVLEKDGWDKESGLLVQVGRRFSGCVDDVAGMTRRQVMDCVDTLMRPFRDFPLADSASRGALLAALLTAVVRPALPTAPAFALDAPSAGSGKTLMGHCLMALGGGGTLYAPLPARDETEIAKVLLSVLMSKPKVALFDNQVGMMDSASLAAVLTSPLYEGRVLGSTRTVKLDTNMMMVMTGNNIAIVGDMTRRVLTVRIDPGCEAPAMRRFDFDALREVQQKRDEMVVAALRLIVWACFQRGSGVQGRVGSFSEWDLLVGQTVAALGLEDYGDPAETLRASQAEDVRAEELAAMLSSMRQVFGGSWFKAADVVEVVSQRVAGHSEIVNALEDALPKGVTKSGVARYMRFRRDARVGPMRLQMRRDPSNQRQIEFRIACDDDETVVNIGTWQEKRKRAKDKIDHLKT